MSASMAEVLAEHNRWYVDLDTRSRHCSACGEQLPYGGLPAHQAEVLAANGYGKLEDAESCCCGTCGL